MLESIFNFMSSNTFLVVTYIQYKFSLNSYRIKYLQYSTTCGVSKIIWRLLENKKYKVSNEKTSAFSNKLYCISLKLMDVKLSKFGQFKFRKKFKIPYLKI